LGQLFDELKRRNVFRVAVTYLVAVWLVLQVADLVLENIGAPDWVMQTFMLLFALGFPFALIFSWAYELTPEGLKREKDVDRDKSVTRRTGRKLNQITIALLGIVVALVAAERLLIPHGSHEDDAKPTAEITDRSIAVLAFEDLSEAGDQEYFADGLSEELLNVLAQVPDLQVAGRTSSFAFKGKDTDLREIGEILNVAHILEGSVRKAGDRIRVTAQLINSDTGFHLFSETYDRDLDDIFSVQDELATMIGTALQSELVGTTAVAEAAPSEVAAYDLYLEARQHIHTRDKSQMETAVELLDQALAIDPDYIPALTQKALAIYLLSDNVGSYGDIPEKEAVAIARPLIDRALERDPRYAEAHAVSALLMDSEGQDIELAIASLRKAIALNPSLENARVWLSTTLTITGRYEESLVLLEGIVERDPMFGPAFNNLIQGYVRTRDYDKATTLIDRVARIVGESEDVRHSRGFVAMTRGEIAEAIRQLEPVYELNPSATIVKTWYGLSLLSLGEYERILEVGLPWMKAEAQIALGEPEAAKQSLDRLIAASTVDEEMETVAYFYAMLDQPDELVRFVDEHYGSPESLLQSNPVARHRDLSYLVPLAWAYADANRKEAYDNLIQAMRAQLELIEAADSVFFPAVMSEAEYAAIVGDDNTLLRAVRKLVDLDAVDVALFDLPYFQAYFDNEDFRALNETIVARANAERAKLGLGPYNPIAVTN
jgi:TolB-like protein/Tfp pilus assembly protein PilF